MNHTGCYHMWQMLAEYSEISTQMLHLTAPFSMRKVITKNTRVIIYIGQEHLHGSRNLINQLGLVAKGQSTEYARQVVNCPSSLQEDFARTQE